MLKFADVHIAGRIPGDVVRKIEAGIGGCAAVARVRSRAIARDSGDETVRIHFANAVVDGVGNQQVAPSVKLNASPENPTLDWPATVEIRLFGRFVPLNCHWNRSGPPPTTPTLRIRVFPARTVWLAGWLVMIGCACKELVPGTSATTTMSFRVRLFISAESISWPDL